MRDRELTVGEVDTVRTYLEEALEGIERLERSADVSFLAVLTVLEEPGPDAPGIFEKHADSIEYFVKRFRNRPPPLAAFCDSAAATLWHSTAAEVFDEMSTGLYHLRRAVSSRDHIQLAMGSLKYSMALDSFTIARLRDDLGPLLEESGFSVLPEEGNWTIPDSTVRSECPKPAQPGTEGEEGGG